MLGTSSLCPRMLVCGTNLYTLTCTQSMEFKHPLTQNFKVETESQPCYSLQGETRGQESGDGDSVLDGKWKRVSYPVESIESCVWVKHAWEEGRVWP